MFQRVPLRSKFVFFGPDESRIVKKTKTKSFQKKFKYRHLKLFFLTIIGFFHLFRLFRKMEKIQQKDWLQWRSARHGQNKERKKTPATELNIYFSKSFLDGE